MNKLSIGLFLHFMITTLTSGIVFTLAIYAIFAILIVAYVVIRSIKIKKK